jgi:hypothetical protein
VYGQREVGVTDLRPSASELSEWADDLDRQLDAIAKRRECDGEVGGVDEEDLDRLRDIATGIVEVGKECEEKHQDLAAEYSKLWTDAKAAVLIADGKASDLEEARQVLLAPGARKAKRAKAENTQAAELIEIGRRAELFKTPTGDLIARFPVGSHGEASPIRSKPFRLWLASEFHGRHRKPPQSAALASAIEILEGDAQFRAPVREARPRVSERDGSIFIDRGDEAWTAIEVTRDGCSITSSPPVLFRRSRGTEPLPAPIDGGSIDLFRPFANVATEEDFKLIVAWAVMAFWPRGPYPALMLYGRQGTAKSTITRYLRSTIDPNKAISRDNPREPRDLAIAANHNHVLSIDNASALRDWESDAFARLATGAGFGTRKLYADDEEVLFQAQRPIVMNGIEELAARGDLLDRSIVIELPPLTKRQRRPEAELDADFERDCPLILGALLGAVSCALRRLHEVNLDRLPRMADFARVIEAASPALGWEPGEFLDAYDANRDVARGIELDASTIGRPLIALVDGSGGKWRGSAKELRAALARKVDDDRVTKGNGWPKTDKALHGAIRRIAETLEEVNGIEVDRQARDGHRGDRVIEIRRIDADTSADTSPPADTSEVSADTSKCQPETRSTPGGPEGADTSDTSRPLSSVGPQSVEREEGRGREVRQELSEVSAGPEGGAP